MRMHLVMLDMYQLHTLDMMMRLVQLDMYQQHMLDRRLLKQYHYRYQFDMIHMLYH